MIASSLSSSARQSYWCRRRQGSSVSGLRIPQLDHNGKSCLVRFGCVEAASDGWEIGRDHPLG